MKFILHPDCKLAALQAEAIIANPISYGHIHIADALGLPLHFLFSASSRRPLWCKSAVIPCVLPAHQSQHP